MYHAYTLLEIAAWVWYGWIQRILLILPLVNPEPAGYAPVKWWWRYYNEWQWESNLSADRIPDKWWIRRYQEGAHKLAGVWVGEVGDYAYGQARSWVVAFMGYVQHNFPTFSDWIETIWLWVNFQAGWWGGNLRHAADMLRDWIPYDIRQGWKTWWGIWEGIKDAVKDWAKDRFDDARADAIAAYEWVISDGGPIRTWVNSVKQWIDNFRANPVGFITSALGAAWTWLVAFWVLPGAVIQPFLGPNFDKLKTFAVSAVTYYYNLWGSYAEELAAFLADPTGWLYDKAEEELLRRW